MKTKLNQIVTILMVTLVGFSASATEWYGSLNLSHETLSNAARSFPSDRTLGAGLGLLLGDHTTLGLNYQQKLGGNMTYRGRTFSKYEVAMTMIDVGYYFKGAQKSSLYGKIHFGVFDIYKQENTVTANSTGYTSGGGYELAAGASVGYQFQVSEKSQIFLGPEVFYAQAFSDFNDSIFSAKVVGSIWF